MKTFDFEFPEGYKLVVTEKGFHLVDTRTDEILVDASNLEISYWLVEICAHHSNRDFYITSNSLDEFNFGITRRK